MILNSNNLGIFSQNIAGSFHIDVYMQNHKNSTMLMPLNCEINKDYPFSESSIFITHNSDIKIKNNEFIDRFSLSRLKINFRAYYIHDGTMGVINIPGELIDFGITHNIVRDTLENIFETHIHTTNTILLEKWNAIESYEFGEKKLKIYSYAIDYYMKDLLNMLFVIPRYPWVSKKYNKILTRITLLATLNLLSKTQQDGFIILSQRIQLADMTENKKSEIDVISFIKELNSKSTIVTMLNYINAKNENLYFSMFFEKVNELDDVLRRTSDQRLLFEFQNFVNIIKKKLLLTENVITDVFSKDQYAPIIKNFQKI